MEVPMGRIVEIIVAFLFLLTILLEDARPAAGFPGTGQAAREVVQETVEFTAKKFGLQLASEAGERFSRRAAGFIARFGDDGVKALRSAGPEAIELAARHGDDAVRICVSHSDDAARFLASHMDDAMPVWRSFGKAGTELMVKHPGLGRPLLESFGRKGIEIGQRLDTQNVRRFLSLARMVKDPAEKGTLADAVLKEGEKVVEFLWKQKYKLAAGYGFYKLMDDYAPSADAAVESGEGIVRKAGSMGGNLVQGVVLSSWEIILKNSPWLMLGITAMALWLLWKLVATLICVLNWVRRIIPAPRPAGKSPSPDGHSLQSKRQTA
jgi:hypothetical protein